MESKNERVDSGFRIIKAPAHRIYQCRPSLGIELKVISLIHKDLYLTAFKKAGF
ncbi:hypothetical protein [Sphingobacterium sp. ML3W]|uniref:hypothetical protein n=1 Tax=Sphingobacterium sp. ML3W TaxID=1538644 RepID=UPI00130DE6C3|nr:hypothetical protein [Sphingobacterium sp. ML3W]